MSWRPSRCGSRISILPTELACLPLRLQSSASCVSTAIPLVSLGVLLCCTAVELLRDFLVKRPRRRRLYPSRLTLFFGVFTVDCSFRTSPSSSCVFSREISGEHVVNVPCKFSNVKQKRKTMNCAPKDNHENKVDMMKLVLLYICYSHTSWSSKKSSHVKKLNQNHNWMIKKLEVVCIRRNGSYVGWSWRRFFLFSIKISIKMTYISLSFDSLENDRKATILYSNIK